MLVTTAAGSPGVTERHARALADELGARFAARDGRTLSHLMKTAGDPEIFVAYDKEVRFKHKDGPFLFFHPSMAMIRVKRLIAGEQDAMLNAGRVAPGDRVIDCTMGLASDAIVYSYAVGETGAVTAVESELIPFILAREGLLAYECGFPSLESAMRRIQPVHEDHLGYLRKQPDNSADIVYFDPMFRKAEAGSSIEPLRGMANPGALRPEAVEQAKRIARKTVVMKEHNRSGEFERLGFRPVHDKPIITYGVINCD